MPLNGSDIVSSVSSKRRKTVKDLSPARILLLGYASVIVLGTILLMLPVSHAPGVQITLIDALFTATSATAVTGLTVVDTASHFSLFGHVVMLVLMQLGGAGLMASVTTVAVVLGWRIGIRQRLLVELDLNQSSMKGVVRLSLRVFAFTLALEAIGAVILFGVFRHELNTLDAWYYAAFHAIAAFCSAGFDLFGNSLKSFSGNITVNLTIAGLFILGGLGFGVLQDIVAHRRWSRLSFHSQVVLTVSGILTLLGVSMVWLLESGNPDTLGSMAAGDRLLAAFFQSATTRSAGFSTVSVDLLTAPTQFLFLVLMFIGASPGSTGGGIKTTTAAILAAIVHSSLRRKRDVELGRFRIDRGSIDSALVVVLGSLLWIAGATFMLLITERADFMPTLFEVVSAMGTVGLSMGLTEQLSDVGKLVISVTMFVGRLGPIAVMLSLGQRHATGAIRRPEKRLIVG